MEWQEAPAEAHRAAKGAFTTKDDITAGFSFTSWPRPSP
eukprot:CAMPEP_0180530036 /NCGR_PEP_ID=MMETSP1036_2-20121128/61702_1 /TAXON_ID=632150 /ORGANISM="Azadinium spinosum, Strain 3D9" /LENGTH=38 /DNA_ID= /DNA_START= /DNA_END= /DNA_ORIENTATION=